MAKKTKRASKSKKKAVPGARRVDAKQTKVRNISQRVIETSSGPKTSSLDPKRSKILRVEENDPQVVKGRMSGDVQNLSAQELNDSESVEELVEEGQDFEGELIQGLENAPPADQGDVKTHGSPDADKEPPDYKDRNRL